MHRVLASRVAALVRLGRRHRMIATMLIYALISAGALSLAYLARFEFDVLLDLGLPELDGLDVLAVPTNRPTRRKAMAKRIKATTNRSASRKGRGSAPGGWRTRNRIPAAKTSSAPQPSNTKRPKPMAKRAKRNLSL